MNSAEITLMRSTSCKPSVISSCTELTPTTRQLPLESVCTV